MTTETFDVIVAGAGLAGLSAAAEIRERAPELRLCVVSSGTPISSQVMGFSAPVAPGDSADKLYEDTLRAGGGENDPALVRQLAERALGELRRLERLGLAFDRDAAGGYRLVGAVGTSCPRVVHHGTETGEAALKLLHAEVRPGRVTQLLSSASGRVSGVVVDGCRLLQARAVVLATGGFCGLWRCATWSSSADGSGLQAAIRAGAACRDLARVQFEPTVTFKPGASRGFPIISTVLREGALLLDRHGRSLLEPGTPPPPKRHLACLIQQCLDRGDGNDDGTVTYDLSPLGLEAFRTAYPGYYEAYRAVSVSAEKLVFHVRPAAHTTLGGLTVDAGCATSLPGLFACGEVMGGLHGADRLGGNAGLETLVFGRLAGASAVAEALSHEQETSVVPARLDTPATPALQTACGDVLQQAITVLPRQENIGQALERLETLSAHPLREFVRLVLQDAQRQGA